MPRVQQSQPTWTEADLIRHLGERLPAQVGAMSPADAAALLPALARRALAEHAIVLSAPEWPRVPDCLRRADGESLYVPHGAARYTTGAQLDLEARLLADAAETGAPRLDPPGAARMLGADQARLEARLRQAHDPGAEARAPHAQGAGAAHDEPEAAPGADSALHALVGCGLRVDQAAAAFWVLTSARRAEVLVGPAGSGKTRTVGELARLWRQAGLGEVIGLATSQNAANVLAAAGPIRAYNTARFLGHLEGRREARGAMPVPRGSLIILDEASMMSLADIAAILAVARRTGSKVVITGDHEQLAAVEGGGAMMLLARRHGYVQLAEPQRFDAEWERDASLRLRSGRRDRARRVRPARPDPRRQPGGSGRAGLPGLARRPPGRPGQRADRPHRGAGPRAVPPRPRRPDPLRASRRRASRAADGWGAGQRR